MYLGGTVHSGPVVSERGVVSFASERTEMRHYKPVPNGKRIILNY